VIPLDATELKKAYNKRLGIFKQALQFFDNPDIPIKAKDEKVDNYLSLLSRMRMTLEELDRLGVQYTTEEMDTGFQI
jgi:hypothetical protein